MSLLNILSLKNMVGWLKMTKIVKASYLALGLQKKYIFYFQPKLILVLSYRKFINKLAS